MTTPADNERPDTFVIGELNFVVAPQSAPNNTLLKRIGPGQSPDQKSSESMSLVPVGSLEIVHSSQDQESKAFVSDRARQILDEFIADKDLNSACNPQNWPTSALDTPEFLVSLGELINQASIQPEMAASLISVIKASKSGSFGNIKQHKPVVDADVLARNIAYNIEPETAYVVGLSPAMTKSNGGVETYTKTQLVGVAPSPEIGLDPITTVKYDSKIGDISISTPGIIYRHQNRTARVEDEQIKYAKKKIESYKPHPYDVNRRAKRARELLETNYQEAKLLATRHKSLQAAVSPETEITDYESWINRLERDTVNKIDEPDVQTIGGKSVIGLHISEEERLIAQAAADQIDLNDDVAPPVIEFGPEADLIIAIGTMAHTVSAQARLNAQVNDYHSENYKKAMGG